MPFEAPHVELAGIMPEVILSGAGIFLLVLHAFIGDRWRNLYLPILASVALVASALFALNSWNENELQLSGMIAADPFAAFVKVSLAVFGLVAVWLGREYFAREDIEQSEYYGLILFAVAG